MPSADDAPQVLCETRAEWRAWLEANHATQTGVWHLSWRPASGRPRVPYEEAVEEALCFGWIDSKGGNLDELRSRQYYAPRNPRSGWARTNKERVTRLIADVTTTTRWPASPLAVASWAACAILSAEPTEVPPNFMTITMRYSS